MSIPSTVPTWLMSVVLCHLCTCHQLFKAPFDYGKVSWPPLVVNGPFLLNERNIWSSFVLRYIKPPTLHPPLHMHRLWLLYRMGSCLDYNAFYLWASPWEKEPKSRCWNLNDSQKIATGSMMWFFKIFVSFPFEESSRLTFDYVPCCVKGCHNVWVTPIM